MLRRQRQAVPQPAEVHADRIEGRSPDLSSQQRAGDASQLRRLHTTPGNAVIPSSIRGIVQRNDERAHIEIPTRINRLVGDHHVASRAGMDHEVTEGS